MTIPMVVRIVAMAVPASMRVPTTSLRPLMYLMTLRMRTNPKGRDTDALVLPGAGKIVAIDPMAKTASAIFQ